jgi:hypothetical protein
MGEETHMLTDLLRRPAQRALVLSVLPALLVTAWLAAQPRDTDPSWHENHHTLSGDWDDLGHNPIQLWNTDGM